MAESLLSAGVSPGVFPGVLPNGLLNGGVPSFQIPISTPAETRARESFTQLLWALSYPGRRYRLPQQGTHTFATSVATVEFASLLAIAYALLDLETTFFTPDVRLASAMVGNGARPVNAASAAYHFYPGMSTQLDSARRDSAQRESALLTHAAEAAVGTLLYPDQAATLVIGCRLGEGVAMRLRGPGILGENVLRVGGLPMAFWRLRAERVLYPLGWDLFLLDGDEVVGLPRTTLIEVIENNGAGNEGEA